MWAYLSLLHALVLLYVIMKPLLVRSCLHKHTVDKNTVACNMCASNEVSVWENMSICE